MPLQQLLRLGGDSNTSDRNLSFLDNTAMYESDGIVASRPLTGVQEEPLPWWSADNTALGFDIYSHPPQPSRKANAKRFLRRVLRKLPTPLILLRGLGIGPYHIIKLLSNVKSGKCDSKKNKEVVHGLLILATIVLYEAFKAAWRSLLPQWLGDWAPYLLIFLVIFLLIVWMVVLGVTCIWSEDDEDLRNRNNELARVL